MTAALYPELSGAAPLCRASEVPEGGVTLVALENRRAIAVYRIGGRFFATDDRCTHGGASLSEGHIEGEVVVCPAHAGEFHIPTGRAMCFPLTRDVRCYPVVERDGEIFIADAVPRAEVPP